MQACLKKLEAQEAAAAAIGDYGAAKTIQDRLKNVTWSIPS